MWVSIFFLCLYYNHVKCLYIDYHMIQQNIRRVDAHLHTLFSDGKLTVSQLIDRCKEHGVKVMAITDHDTVKGVIHWKTLVQNDIIVIPGIEISAYSEKQPQIHITGYFPKSADFSKMEAYLSSHVKEIR